MSKAQYTVTDVKDSELDSVGFEPMEYEITTERVEFNKEQDDV